MTEHDDHTDHGPEIPEHIRAMFDVEACDRCHGRGSLFNANAGRHGASQKCDKCPGTGQIQRRGER